VTSHLPSELAGSAGGAATRPPRGGSFWSIDGCRHDPSGLFLELLRYLPVSLAVRELMRMRALADDGRVALPLLDVGCGDGLFWEVLIRDLARGDDRAFHGFFGIDIDDHELRLASLRLRERGGELRNVDVASHPRASSELDSLQGAFRTVIANCSLEHVHELSRALSNIHELCRSGATLVLFVPAPRWTETLITKRALRRVSPRLAGAWGGAFDGFFRHHHLYPAHVWRQLLEGIGFSEVRVLGLGSQRANRLFEGFLPLALPSFLFKVVTKRYPRLLRLGGSLALRIAAPFLREIASGETLRQDPADPEVVELCIRCRK